MSFSGDTKEELSKQISRARHCQIAEIAAIISLCGRIQINVRNQYCLRMQTENAAVARKYFTLIKKAFNLRPEVSVPRIPPVRKIIKTIHISIPPMPVYRFRKSHKRPHEPAPDPDPE